MNITFITDDLKRRIRADKGYAFWEDILRAVRTKHFHSFLKIDMDYYLSSLNNNLQANPHAFNLGGEIDKIAATSQHFIRSEYLVRKGILGLGKKVDIIDHVYVAEYSLQSPWIDMIKIGVLDRDIDREIVKAVKNHEEIFPCGIQFYQSY